MAESRFNQSKIITIERHILEEQQIHPQATGILTNILYDLALAGKYIASPSFNQVAQPLYSSSVGRWRNYESEYAAIADYLQPFLSEFGYDD